MRVSAENMLNQTVFDTEGRSYILKELIGEGAQGRVFRTDDDFIVKISFERNIDPDALRKHYDWLIRRNFQDVDIAKPVAMLEKPLLGYVMRQVKNYVPLSFYFWRDMEQPFDEWYKETGGLKKRLMIGAFLALNLRNLHIQGLTYVDLSPANVLVAKNKNSIVFIDSDNISVPSVWNPLVIGTGGYIAPEIINGERAPDSLSDTYSFAVILFELLRLSHPFIGDEVMEAAPEVEEEALKGNAVFIDNPEDDSNRNSEIPDANIFLTPRLQELFQKTFIDAMQNRVKRPTLVDFRIACLMAKDLLIQCENCGAFYYWKNESENICLWCDFPAKDIPRLQFCKKASTKSIKSLNLEKFTKENLSRIENYHNLIFQTGKFSLNNYHLDFYDCLKPQSLAKIEFTADKSIFITPSKQTPIQLMLFDTATKNFEKLDSNKTYELIRGRSIIFFDDGFKLGQQFLTEFPNTYYHIYAKIL